YPNNIKEKTKYYPLCPTHKTVEYEELSEFTKQQYESIPKSKKLICDQYDKDNILLDYEHLQSLVEQGLIIKKVRKIYEFEQGYLIKDYIYKNNELRKTLPNDQKYLPKLLNNSAYANFIEVVENRIDTKLLNNEKLIKKHINSIFLKSKIVISDKLELLNMQKKNCNYDKPIYIGFSILEKSKLHMYKSYYKFNDILSNLMLHYTDTDSFIMSFD